MRVSRSLSVFVLCFCLYAGAFVQSPAPLIPRNVLFGNPERTSPEISPDGTMLAYLAPDQGVLNVWVRTLGKTDDRVITNDRKRGIRNFFWQYDSKNILYTQDQNGDENWRIYQSTIATKQTRDLTPYEKVRAEFVALEPAFPDTALIQLNKRDPNVFDVYRVNLKTGELTLDTQNPGDVAGWQADHDLVVRAAQVTTPDGGTIVRVRDNPSAPWRELIKWGPDETLGNVDNFTADNKSLLIISSIDANAARLLSFDLATGKRTVIAEDPQYDVAFTVTHPKTTKLEAVVFLRARRDFQPIGDDIASDLAALKKVRDADISNIGRDLADDKWIVTYEGDDAPIYYYLYDRASKQSTMLFSNRPALEKFKLAKVRPIEYKARDGMVIYGYLTTPADKEAKNLPMVVFPHGGPWGRDLWGYDPNAQWLANRGYAVLQPNFRASTGYGKQYLNAGDRQWAGTMHTDLLDGKDWVVNQGIADAKKVCIMGGSYGGYATLAGVAFSPDVRLRCRYCWALKSQYAAQNHSSLLVHAARRLPQAHGRGRGFPQNAVAAFQGRSDQGSAPDRAGRQRSARQQSRKRPDRRRHAQEQQAGRLLCLSRRGSRLRPSREPHGFRRRQRGVYRQVPRRTFRASKRCGEETSGERQAVTSRRSVAV